MKSLQVSLSLAYILRPSFGLQKFSRNQDKKNAYVKERDPKNWKWKTVCKLV